ncbi:MAG: hypothetical protein NVSMB46_04760 [Candidatus Saccharimonadales bacterium]
MSDSNELKARAVELAERALRLKDRAVDNGIKGLLHAAANELIMLDNEQRFYDAQIKLERFNTWLEDQRSLAHEINVADRAIRNMPDLDLEKALHYLENWSTNYIASTNPEVAEIGQTLHSNLEVLNTAQDNIMQKQALNHILSFVEALLAHTAVTEKVAINNTVLFMRATRDNLLVARELLYDEDDLLTKYKEEGTAVDRLSVARHVVDELYKTAQQ